MKNLIRINLLVLTLTALIACSGNNNNSEIGPANYDIAGPYPVGNTTVTVTNHTDGRVLTVELWYPAETPGDGQSIQQFAIDEPQRAELDSLLAENPDNCVSLQTSAGRALEPSRSMATFPLVAFSHCSECARFSSFSLAERLASHGIAVAAPDHAMNTLFDTGAMLNSEFLAVRANDIRAVVDELLIPNSAALPENLQGKFDGTKLGMAGHSYGAVTTGKVLQDDPRFKAGFIMAAPVENPLIPGVEVARIEEPTLYMIAREDNSITELGNILMRSNFEAAASPAWKVEVNDAGHWSFSDIAGITPGFQAGCGAGERQTVPGEPFTYLDIEVGLQTSSTYGMRFFAAHLLEDATALQALSESTNSDIVAIEMK